MSTNKWLIINQNLIFDLQQSMNHIHSAMSCQMIEEQLVIHSTIQKSNGGCITVYILWTRIPFLLKKDPSQFYLHSYIWFINHHLNIHILVQLLISISLVQQLNKVKFTPWRMRFLKKVSYSLFYYLI